MQVFLGDQDACVPPCKDQEETGCLIWFMMMMMTNRIVKKLIYDLNFDNLDNFDNENIQVDYDHDNNQRSWFKQISLLLHKELMLCTTSSVCQPKEKNPRFFYEIS